MPTLMMNPERLRASLRRLFSNEWHEILGELLQNAQRAGATEVHITTHPTGFTMADNGHGLQHGLQSIETLLSLGDSAFENAAVADQHPMGLGVHALLAAEGVSAVCFRSERYAVTIDTARWWTDSAYIEHWQDQVTLVAEPVRGMQIDVTCTERVTRTLTGELQTRSTPLLDRTTAHEGYADLLTVTLDGTRLNTATPFWVLPEPILTTTYQGCDLTIGTSDRYTKSAVNWYGQIILVGSRIPFYLHVRAGRPVNPLAPSRRGLIQDTALAALEQFIADALFIFLETQPVEVLHPDWIALAWSADPERARQLPVCVVAPLCSADPDTPILSADDLNQSDGQQVVRIDAAPLLIDETIQVATATLPAEALAKSWCRPAPGAEREPWEWADFGRDPFLPMLLAAGQIPYTLIHGDESRLPIQTVWWQPGPERADEFNERGSWGLSTCEEPPEVWEPVTRDVWAFTEPNNTDATAVDWAVGTTDPLQFLAQPVWAGYRPDDESAMSEDEQERYYQESVSEWKRELVGDCVSSTFSPRDLQRLMPDRTAPVVQLTLQYTEELSTPTSVLVENAAGERKTIRFLD